MKSLLVVLITALIVLAAIPTMAQTTQSSIPEGTAGKVLNPIQVAVKNADGIDGVVRLRTISKETRLSFNAACRIMPNGEIVALAQSDSQVLARYSKFSNEGDYLDECFVGTIFWISAERFGRQGSLKRPKYTVADELEMAKIAKLLASRK